MDDSTKRIQDHFGPHADKYATSAVHAQGESLTRLIELTHPQSNWLVLDVSTGAGHTALTFAPKVARVIAVDLTPQMLSTAERLANERGITNIEFRPADVHSLPFDDNTFDLVTNRIALHHFSDVRKAIAEMARVCKRGGIVAVTDNVVPPDKVAAGYINHFEQMRERSHNWAYPVVRLQAMVTDAGLKIEHTETLDKEIEFEAWTDRAGASAELKAQLLERLNNAPQDVKDFLKPQTRGDKTFFALHETIIIARKD